MALMLGNVFAALTCDKFAFDLPGMEHKSLENTGLFFASGLKIIIPTTVYASKCRWVPKFWTH